MAHPHTIKRIDTFVTDDGKPDYERIAAYHKRMGDQVAELVNRGLLTPEGHEQWIREQQGQRRIKQGV